VKNKLAGVQKAVLLDRGHADSALKIVIKTLKILAVETFQELQDELKGARGQIWPSQQALGGRSSPTVSNS
jgi:hypothetical protein